MKEIVPQFTYQDGTLNFFVLPPSGPYSQTETQWATALEQLDALTNVGVTTATTGHIVTADVHPYLQKGVYEEVSYVSMDQMLGLVAGLLPYKSSVDVGLSLSTVGRRGVVTDIHPSVQTWLQDGGLDQDVKVAGARAMCDVYGLKPAKAISHWDVVAATDAIDFETALWEDHEDATVEKVSVITLNVPFLQTLGDCACLGSNASSRRIYMDDDYADLYSLESHNVDNLRQTLSLIIGLGTIAANMPHSFDETALFKDVSWREQIFPKS